MDELTHLLAAFRVKWQEAVATCGDAHGAKFGAVCEALEDLDHELERAGFSPEVRRQVDEIFEHALLDDPGSDATEAFEAHFAAAGIKETLRQEQREEGSS